MEVDTSTNTKTKRITAKDKDNHVNYQAFLRNVFNWKKSPATDHQRVKNTPSQIKEKISKWNQHPNNMPAGSLSKQDFDNRIWTINQFQNWHLGERQEAMRRINKANKAVGVTVAQTKRVKPKSKSSKKKKTQQPNIFGGTQSNGAVQKVIPGSKEELLNLHDELVASLRELEDKIGESLRHLKDVTIAINRAACDIKD